MNEIYNLIGRIIHTFQELEDHLAILVYCHFYGQHRGVYNEIHNIALEQYAKMDKATLGQKLHQALKENLMTKDEEDYMVLDYLTVKRNNIVHHYFIDNIFFDQRNIERSRIELTELLQQAQLVEKAYNRMMLSELQRLDIIS